MKTSKHRHAFSLIELMVVAAVVFSVLAAVMPLYSVKKDRAMGSQCMSNLKQIGVGMKLYGTDWNGKFPWAY